ncbi:hypothetical protein MycrhDRAFT_5513 [Mycolicibacterium rhodesiae JS60]|nr:hypothetical protein MycrhDRAFT_5513 [Mycolicibacterium rhodesiae JS60]
MRTMNLAGRREDRTQPAFGAYVQGLIGAVALGSLASTGGATATGVVPVAIGMGIAAAVFAVAGWLSAVSDVFYSLLGLAAFVPDAVRFVRSNDCLPGPPPALRFAAVALLVSVAVLMLAARVLTLRRVPILSAGLALYAALQVLVPLSTFIAGEASASNALWTAALIPAAAALGWCVISLRHVVEGVAGVALGMQSIYTAAVGPECGQANFTGVVLIVVFTGAYFAVRAVCAPFAGRR